MVYKNSIGVVVSPLRESTTEMFRYERVDYHAFVLTSVLYTHTLRRFRFITSHKEYQHEDNTDTENDVDDAAIITKVIQILF